MNHIKILIYGHLFPNPVEPVKGTFVFYPLSYYPDDIEFKVVAPVPFLLSWWRRKRNIKINRNEIIKVGDRTIEVFRPVFFQFPRNLFRRFMGYLEYLTTYKTVLNVTKQWHPDLIHVNFAYPDGIAARYISDKIGISYIITEHQGALEDLLSIGYLRKQITSVYKDAAAVVTVSDFTKTIISKYTDNIDVQVIHNGVAVDEFILTKKRAQPAKCVFIGNLIFKKGIHLFLKALYSLKLLNVNIEFSIIGSGKYKENLISLTNELGLHDSVNFLGNKSRKEIIKLLPTYDFLVIPSLIESFSIVILEAFSSGLPVISTKCGGPEETVNEYCGVLSDVDSSIALTDAVLELIKSWDMYNPVYIREYVKENYDIHIIVNQITSLYMKSLGL